MHKTNMFNHLDRTLVDRITSIVPQLEGWCSVEKALALAACVCEIRPRTCVEIGVFGGRSLLPQAMACCHRNAGHVFGIDPWSDSHALEGHHPRTCIEFWSQVNYEQIYRGCVQAIVDAQLGPFCTLIRMSSANCAHLFQTIDLLHIDGNHDASASIRDVQLYLPKVPMGGHIWFDDADWEATGQAKELLLDECDIVHDYGSYLHLRKRPRSTKVISSGEVIREALATPHLERRQIISSTDTRLGEYRGGIYNPGAVRLDGEFVLLARNERFTELERQRNPALWQDSCRPYVLHLDDHQQITAHYPLTLDPTLRDGRVEDFRLFWHRGQLYCGYSHVVNPGHIESRVSALDLSRRTFGPSLRPQVDFTCRPIEKNWCYFEHAGDLYVVYSFRPFRLLKCRDLADFRFETVVTGTVDVGQPEHGLRRAPLISLSTNPIPFRGELLMFIHWRDGYKNYQHHAVLLDPDTLQPTCITRWPMFSGGDANGLHPHVLYLMSALSLNDSLWCFLGEGDEHISCATVSLADLEQRLNDCLPIEFGTQNINGMTGDYNYEHRGEFQRHIRLNPDGTIEQGGDHDSEWRLEQVDGISELWVLGGGSVSCRLRQTSAGHWSGIWNWGGRPEARLTRIEKD